jgi:hypothetical protein
MTQGIQDELDGYYSLMNFVSSAFAGWNQGLGAPGSVFPSAMWEAQTFHLPQHLASVNAAFGKANQITKERSSDPCIGRDANALNYDATNGYATGPATGAEHIKERHILDSDGSTYRGTVMTPFGPLMTTTPGMQAKFVNDIFALVQQWNAMTFQFGKGIKQSNGNIRFEFQISIQGIDLPYRTTYMNIGDDINTGKSTAWNTLVVKSDCKTVWTSHPGLTGKPMPNP